MIFGIHLPYCVYDNAFFVDDVCGAEGSFGRFAVHFLFAPGFVGFEDGEVGVGDEMERQLIFCDELLVRDGAVAAHSQHVVTQCDEAVIVVAEVAGLSSTARGAVFRIEIQNELLSSEI